MLRAVPGHRAPLVAPGTLVTPGGVLSPAMDRSTQQALTDVLARLAHYGPARDRATEREPRTITITDDEALAILEGLNFLSPGGIWGTPGPQ